MPSRAEDLHFWAQIVCQLDSLVESGKNQLRWILAKFYIYIYIPYIILYINNIIIYNNTIIAFNIFNIVII